MSFITLHKQGDVKVWGVLTLCPPVNSLEYHCWTKKMYDKKRFSCADASKPQLQGAVTLL